MAIKRQREVALTAVAIVVLAGAVLAYRLHTIAPAPAASAPAAVPAATSTPAASTPAGLTELNLPALNARRGERQETVRDPFRFKPKPPPPPPPTVMQPIAPQPTGPVEPPPPPRIALKFFGVFDSKKGPLAGLSDGRYVYKGHVGDTIEGRYRILRIGVESIDLAYLDGRGKQTIRLSGQ